MAKFDIFNGFVNQKEENKMKKENVMKEYVAPEIKNARSFWYGVMAPAIKAAKRAADNGLTMNEAKSQLVHQLVNKCSSYGEYKRMEESQFEIAYMEARAKKQERDRRREAIAAEKRARQAALAARHLEKQNSVSRIAVAIGWTVNAVTDALKAIKNGIKNATVKAYKAALKNARRERLNAASMFTAIGDLITDAQAYVMHIIGLINEDAAADSVAY